MQLAVLITTSGNYIKISLLPILSQINTIAYFVKVKITDLLVCFQAEQWLLASLLTWVRHAVKFENRRRSSYCYTECV